MICENCNKEHDGSYASGRFCCKECSKAFSTKAKRKKINEKVSASLKGKESPFKGMDRGKRGPCEKQSLKMKEYWKDKKKTDTYKRARNVAHVIAYRAKKKDAITESTDFELIKRIYENCPIGYEVDHIIPLSKNGKHHQDNLQYLNSIENRRKGKRLNYECKDFLDWRHILNAQMVEW